MDRRCGNCGAELEETADRCPNCGGSIAPSWPPKRTFLQTIVAVLSVSWAVPASCLAVVGGAGTFLAGYRAIGAAVFGLGMLLAVPFVCILVVLQVQTLRARRARR